MVDEHGLTPKQRKFADIAIETGNGTKAALATYDTDSYFTAGSIATENLKKPKIVQYISTQCKIAGLTVPKVLLRLAEELDAERTLIAPTGEVIGKEADHHARHRAIETAIKYAIPEFVALRQQGGHEGSGSRHLHLHGVAPAALARSLPDDDTVTD